MKRVKKGLLIGFGAVLVLGFTLLMGCGQSGPLCLPEDAVEEVAKENEKMEERGLMDGWE